MYFKSSVTMMQSTIKVAKLGITVLKLYKPDDFILFIYTVMLIIYTVNKLVHCKGGKVISHALEFFFSQNKWISLTGNT